MRILVFLVATLGASGALAASDAHSDCVDMLANAYLGTTTARGDAVAVNEFLFSQVRSGTVPIEQKEATDTALVNFEKAAHEMIDILSQTCEAIRSNSP